MASSQSLFPCFINNERGKIDPDIEHDNIQLRHAMDRMRFFFQIVQSHSHLFNEDSEILSARALSIARIDLNQKAAFTDKEINAFIQALRDLYPSLQIADQDNIARRTARNFLRHLTLGSVVENGEKGKDYKDCLAQIEKCLNEEKDPALIRALRIEIQALFDNALKWLNDNPLPAQVEQFQIFMKGILAILPFLDPEADETIVLPQLAADIENKEAGIEIKWVPKRYRFKEIDLSPKKGPLFHLMHHEDHIFAYALEPLESMDLTRTSIDKNASCYLLLPGTTFPTGKGEKISVLENFRPGGSVGEKHDTTDLDDWINTQKDKSITVTGQSKGAVNAMITAARFPEKVKEAHCLCPTGLNKATLDRLNPNWRKIPKEKKPAINVYVQQSDPVFPLGHGFLEGTRITKIVPKQKTVSSYKWYIPTWMQRRSEAHIHNFAGRGEVEFISKNTHERNLSPWREFRSNIQDDINHFFFPILYIELCVHFLVRNLEKKAPILKLITYPLSWIAKPATLILKMVIGLILVIGSVASSARSTAQLGFKKQHDYQVFSPQSTTTIMTTTGKLQCRMDPIITPTATASSPANIHPAPVPISTLTYNEDSQLRYP